MKANSKLNEHEENTNRGREKLFHAGCLRLNLLVRDKKAKKGKGKRGVASSPVPLFSPFDICASSMLSRMFLCVVQMGAQATWVVKRTQTKAS